jgi:hypothetical protein
MSLQLSFQTFKQVLNCEFAMVVILVDSGADPNTKNKDGETSLHLACCHGHLDRALLLIRHGANVYIRDNDGSTPLNECCDERPMRRISRQVVETAYIREQRWRRRKDFVRFLSWLYGTADAQDAQQELQQPDAPPLGIAVRSSNRWEWAVLDKALSVRGLQCHIASYL